MNTYRRSKITKTVTESIFSKDGYVIPMADVQHIEGAYVITKHTKYNFEHNFWENAILLPADIQDEFKRAWCVYRRELEIDTLKNIEPDPCEKCTLAVCDPYGEYCINPAPKDDYKKS